jgi:peptidoglycan/xylan/chitin deacetylase (PgdA/CDA1 family)
MRTFWRGLIVAAAIAAGTWVGFHPRSDAKSVVAPPPSAAPLPPAVPAAPEVSPPSTDTADARPWPQLNEERSLSKAWRIADGPHRKPGEHRKFVTLTFDDGPFPETTPRVLDLLAKHDVHATFFVIGRYLDGDSERAVASREVLKKTVEAGHLIGNHTHDHALLTTTTHTQVLDQIDRGSASIERVIGKKPLLIRPPYGQLDEFGQKAVRERGLDILLWNVEAQDMERQDTYTMYTELVHQLAVKDGGVVLLHDIRWSSIHILERLLAYLDAKKWDPARPNRDGYVVVDLPTYLREIEANPPREKRRAKR